jgi:hypothetical protein
MMDALSLDQFAVFAAIAEEGSFAAAARRLNRAQSAITYAIQKLEDQTGVPLFDRSACHRIATGPASTGREWTGRGRVHHRQNPAFPDWPGLVGRGGTAGFELWIRRSVVRAHPTVPISPNA